MKMKKGLWEKALWLITKKNWFKRLLLHGGEIWGLVNSTTLRISWNKLKGISNKEEVQKEKEDEKTEIGRRMSHEETEKIDEVLVEDIRTST